VRNDAKGTRLIGYDPIVTVSAAKQIAEQIKAAILEGKIKEEERLPTEWELAAKFGVSRPTVREALKRLAAQNLISSRRGPTGGTFVNRMRLEDLAENVTSSAMMLLSVNGARMDELAQARIELENICCRLAIEQQSPNLVSELQMLLDRQQDPKISDEDFCALDVQFHRKIVDASGNMMLRFIMYAVIEALVPITNMVIVFVRDRSRIVHLHERILEGIKRSDIVATQSHLRSLVAYLIESYGASIKERDTKRVKQPPRSRDTRNRSAADV
jgi:GntR family transcriptional regulator, transcriptional repressor for pyruvate dehydrogenase complex